MLAKIKKTIIDLLFFICKSKLGYFVVYNSFELFEKLTNYSIQKRSFRILKGYKLNLKNPKSFNEKICWRKIYDHNPLFPKIVDKYKVNDYLIKKLGKKEAENIIIPLYHVTDKPKTIPFDKLPDEYIIKANHGSGTNIFVFNEKDINKKQIIKQCKNWLKEPYGIFRHEWAYQKIKRKIIIQKLIRDKEGNIPKDFKFHVFHGKTFMIQVNEGLFFDKENRTLTLFTPEWKKFDLFWEFKPNIHVDKPKNFKKMLMLAEKLAEDFDYVRVDLYDLGDEIKFGELTIYPTSGQAKVNPKSFDFKVGENWTLPRKGEHK